MDFSTTLDEGRLHVASGTQYQGSIDTYNNFVTRLSRFFGYSTYVTIDGQAHCVNNNSYIDFLRKLGVDNISLANLSEYRNLDTANVTLLTNRLPMRHFLTLSKTNELAEKLISAIGCSDSAKASKLLSQGANPNRTFWIRGYDGDISFNAQFNSNLPHRKINPFTATRFNPVLFAASKCHDAIVEDLKKYGADVNFTGRRFKFSRDIVDVSTHYSLQTAMHLDVVPSRHVHHRDIYGRPIGCSTRRPHLENRLGLDGVNQQTITYEDRQTDHKTFTLNALNNRLKFTDKPGLNQSTRWSSTTEVGRARIF